MDHTTGIVLAINEKLRSERVRRQFAFLGAIYAELGTRQSSLSTLIRDALDEYVMLDRKDPREDVEFYRTFEQRAEQWLPDDDDFLIRTCDKLIERCRFRPARSQPSNLRGGASMHWATTPSAFTRSEPDAAVAEPSAVVLPVLDLPTTPNAPLGAPQLPPPPTSSEEERRCFLEINCKDIVAPIFKPVYFRLAGELQKLLSRPEGVSEDEITEWLIRSQPSTPAAAEGWEAASTEVSTRFANHWPNASRPQKAENPLGLRSRRD